MERLELLAALWENCERHNLRYVMEKGELCLAFGPRGYSDGARVWDDQSAYRGSATVLVGVDPFKAWVEEEDI